MATAHQIRDLITETTTGTVRPRIPREMRDAISRFVAGAPRSTVGNDCLLSRR